MKTSDNREALAQFIFMGIVLTSFKLYVVGLTSFGLGIIAVIADYLHSRISPYEKPKLTSVNVHKSPVEIEMAIRQEPTTNTPIAQPAIAASGSSV